MHKECDNDVTGATGACQPGGRGRLEGRRGGGVAVWRGQGGMCALVEWAEGRGERVKEAGGNGSLRSCSQRPQGTTCWVRGRGRQACARAAGTQLPRVGGAYAKAGQGWRYW
jgi:hypothetical protein